VHATRSHMRARRARLAYLPIMYLTALMGGAVPINPGYGQATTSGLATDRELGTCTYYACALRIEEGTVLKGAEGHRITDLHAFPWSSDSASAHAAGYRANHTTGTALRVLAFAGTLGSLGLILKATADAMEAEEADETDQDAATADFEQQYRIAIGISLGSSAVGLVGRLFDSRARKQLSRAVWWHNRAFAR
jgi:hypothetical protein